MHQGLDFLFDLATVMVIAGITTVVFHRLRQPVVLGYLLAGLIIGPNTPPYSLITNHDSIEVLGQLGIIFLMFRMGLHFNFRKLYEVGVAAVVAGLFEILAMIMLGFSIGRAFGWSEMDSLFLGALLSISSTTIIVKTLIDQKLVDAPFARIIFAVLIVEDILAVALIAFLSTYASSGTLNLGIMTFSMFKLLIFLVSTVVVGLLVVPRILRLVSHSRDSEILLVAVLGLCFGTSLLAAKLGYSVALGAFLIGAIVSECREAGLIERRMLPLRDMFSAIFFVTVGMLIDPKLLTDHWITVGISSLVVIFGKVITCSVGCFLAGRDARTSLMVGFGLAQIGEFSFIIAQLGESLRVTSAFMYPLAVAVAGVTSFVNPYLMRDSEALVNVITRAFPKRLVRMAALYQGWISQLRFDEVRTHVMHKALHLLVNVLLLSGILICAIPAEEYVSFYFTDVPGWIGGTNGAAWLAAMIVALPVIVSSIHTLSAIATLLAPHSLSISNTTSNQRVLFMYYILFSIGCSLLVLWIVALSIVVVPSWPVLLGLLAFVAVIALVIRRRLHALYNQLHESLLLTFNQTEVQPATVPQQMGIGLEGVEMGTASIAASSPAAGKLVRELHLRADTGVTIVAIDRQEGRVVAPGPDEEIKVHDTVFLLGSAIGIQKARELLEVT